MQDKPIPNTVRCFFEQYDQFIIVGHKEPDGDCISCQIALQSFITRYYHKKSILVSAGPFKRTEVKTYELLFSKNVPQEFVSAQTGLIVVDCTCIDRTGEIQQQLTDFPTLIIDHHASNTTIGDNTFINDSAPAAAILVQQIIESITGKAVTADEASQLFFGLATDSGFFRHLDQTSAPVFVAAARLIDAGANPKEIFARMNGGKTAESRQLISRILSRLEYYYDNHLAVSWETLEDTAAYGIEGRDSDSLYQLIQSIKGIEAIVILRQETEDACTIGFRSLNTVNVCTIAQQFGGGGHKNASGAKVQGTIASLKPQVISAFSKVF